MDEKPLSIRFDKVDGVIKVYGGIRYLEIFNLYSVINVRIDSRIYNTSFDMINYLIT